MIEFEVNSSEFPPTCLPVDIDQSNWIDITAIGDSWKKYLDISTGKIHDGEEYHRQMISQVRPAFKE